MGADAKPLFALIDYICSVNQDLSKIIEDFLALQPLTNTAGKTVGWKPNGTRFIKNKRVPNTPERHGINPVGIYRLAFRIKKLLTHLIAHGKTYFEAAIPGEINLTFWRKHIIVPASKLHANVGGQALFINGHHLQSKEPARVYLDIRHASFICDIGLLIQFKRYPG